MMRALLRLLLWVEESAVALAIFDLDNTLIAGDSDYAWGEFLVRTGLVDQDRFREANEYFYQQYKAGQLDIDEYLEFALKPLTEHSQEKLAELHEAFMQTMIEPILLPKAFELLQWHRERGDFLLIITATNTFVTAPIGRKLGVDALLGIEPEIENARYTGRYLGIPTFQGGKVKRLYAWLAEQPYDLKGSYFYSDSHNDLPLLELVEHPVAVDADEKLSALAAERGWRQISLRG